MGGIRGVAHYMQRTALQGSPAVLSSVVGQWLAGAPKPEGDRHPFRKRISELEIGYTLTDPKNWEGDWKGVRRWNRVDDHDIGEVECLPDLNEHLQSTSSKVHVR